MRLSEQIRKYRKSSGLTQEALAEKLNTTRQSVSKWEQGSLEPNIQMLNNLSKLFDVSLDNLVNGKERLENTDNKDYTHVPMNIWEFASKKWWLIIIIVLIIGGTLSQIFG
ncbi:helix-turn-helix domain-containing protein [Staphylococcus delphini]|uniref:helix-turn-helix domain-containing protein n=1 Tax=Staphylococcus delphini TaxID=53344 RepID=UPI000BBBEEEA|nr:helix-turn-helix transcriptional regulator [Staphylococcus delphini]PCF45031.1 transcriptional regulator [Staphylococcus delphini]PCF76602.1 transcriptional regulator [Staphylococcus delphini]